MVFMEYVKGHTVDKAPVLPKDAREKAEKAIRKLHDAQLVLEICAQPTSWSRGTKCS